MRHLRDYFMILFLFAAVCIMVVLLKNMILEWAEQPRSGQSEPDYTDAFREGGYMSSADMKIMLSDAVYFPVPESSINSEATVSYENSWMFERTFGGKRGHEGCDIMADIDRRGMYPVISISSGKIEKLGWLRQGGYRIGIRSENGFYFYYAHLYSYAEGLQEGNEVKAGELLGYMGDSGYSDTVGTVGNFSVHLHLGLYINTSDGEELSLNPYPLLRKLDSEKLSYIY